MQNLELPQVPLGNTKILISKLGLGTVKFGRNTGVNYAQPFNLPDDRTIKQLLGLAKTLKINLLDTAPAYGTSEERLGKLLSPQDRSTWVICSKVGEEFIGDHSVFNFSREYIKHSLERSLKRLRTDYLDLLLIHSNGQDQEIINNYEVFNTLADLKQQGLIRAFGMSTKTPAGGLLSLKYADLVMVTLNFQHVADLPVIQTAHSLNKGVLIKKALNQGKLPLAPSMKFIFDTPGVHSVILGTIDPAHLLAAAQSIIN